MPGRSGAHALKRDAEEAGMGSSPRSAPELKRTVSTDAFEAFVDSPRRPPPPPSLVKALLPAPLSTSPPKRRVFWARSGECPPDLGMMRMLNVEARSRHRVDGNPPVGHYATTSIRVKRGAAPTSTVVRLNSRGIVPSRMRACKTCSAAAPARTETFCFTTTTCRS